MTPSQHSILGFQNSRFFNVDRVEPAIINFVDSLQRKNDTFPKWDLRIPKFQISIFFEFDRFEPQITDSVNNL